jgi:plasmid stabilization system protein ParE
VCRDHRGSEPTAQPEYAPRDKTSLDQFVETLRVGVGALVPTRRTRHLVFFRVNREAQEVVVLRVWHSSRSRPATL